MIIDEIMVVQKQDMQKHVRIPEITYTSCHFSAPGPKNDMGKLARYIKFESGVLNLGYRTEYVFCIQA
jgi:hypothetical protein